MDCSRCDKLTRRAKFRFPRRANQRFELSRPARQEGRAHVTNARRDAVDACSRLTTAWIKRTAKPCGPGARCWRQAVGEAQAGTAATESTKNSSPGRSRHK